MGYKSLLQDDGHLSSTDERKKKEVYEANPAPKNPNATSKPPSTLSALFRSRASIRAPHAPDLLSIRMPARLRSDALMLARSLDGRDLVDAVRVTVDVERAEGIGPRAPVDLSFKPCQQGRLFPWILHRDLDGATGEKR